MLTTLDKDMRIVNPQLLAILLLILLELVKLCVLESIISKCVFKDVLRDLQLSQKCFHCQVQIHSALLFFVVSLKTQQNKTKMKLNPISPNTLVYQCIDHIFTWIAIQTSKQSSFQNSVNCLQTYLSELPKELQNLILKSAEKHLDQTYTVRSLVVIWLSCVDNGTIKEISTPRYLYNDEEGRKRIINKLDNCHHCEKVRQISFLMYSFYSHLRSNVWKNKNDAEFILQGNFSFCLQQAIDFT